LNRQSKDNDIWGHLGNITGKYGRCPTNCGIGRANYTFCPTNISHENHWNCCHQMAYFEANKLHQIWFRKKTLTVIFPSCHWIILSWRNLRIRHLNQSLTVY